jgi:para-nitrobenzyl esterase
MENFFANFIINGNPNGADLPEWPTAKPGDKNPEVMNIDVDLKVMKATDDAQFEFLDKNYGNRK